MINKRSISSEIQKKIMLLYYTKCDISTIYIILKENLIKLLFKYIMIYIILFINKKEL